MDTIRIQFTLFSAFYSPLISTMSGGFLRAEGLDAQWSISPPGVSALAALEDGSAHVVQSALSQGFTTLNNGETPAAVHFAQVNEMDGFFITGRKADPDFTWKKLEGAQVVMFKGGQPRAMFRYACHKAGIDFEKIRAVCPGGAAEIGCQFLQFPYIAHSPGWSAEDMENNMRYVQESQTLREGAQALATRAADMAALMVSGQLKDCTMARGGRKAHQLDVKAQTSSRCRLPRVG
jgi:ABC-type nitrate/sulfonate/bicarbonate transport system substrate-binding protein